MHLLLQICNTCSRQSDLLTRRRNVLYNLFQDLVPLPTETPAFLSCRQTVTLLIFNILATLSKDPDSKYTSTILVVLYTIGL